MDFVAKFFEVQLFQFSVNFLFNLANSFGGITKFGTDFLQLHTQFNRDIPWASIDMDFMNLNQSAHGDREHGYIHARMRLPRKVVAGFWQDGEVRRRIGVWMRAAAARADGLDSVVLRLGDNMREVAVTEGDKVEAQIKFGWQVNTWGIGPGRSV